MAEEDVAKGARVPEGESEVVFANGLLCVAQGRESEAGPCAAASPAKMRANRRNAQHSTGPRTLAGKARASKNAMRHGLLSRDTLLSDEKREEYDAFRRRMWRALTPEGELEALLADRVVSSAWRLHRLLRLEAENLGEAEDFLSRRLSPGESFVSLSVNGDIMSKFSRYEGALERGLFRALHELQRLQAVRAGAVVSVPVAVDVDLSGATTDGPGL